MSSIDWIEQLPDAPEDIAIHDLVDSSNAVQIVLEEGLNIDQPEENVRQFVETVPALLVWFRSNYREFPWRRTRDPWEVIAAEILLQRTHASTVARIFPEFIDRYPSPYEANRASDSQLYESVESLGFGNKRTNTLRELSRVLVEDYHGEVPHDVAELQKLPRIGPYTARACLCFAFGQPLALVDSNVEVVVRRVFDYSSTERAHKDESLYAFLDALIPADPDLARAFNLAILDLRNAICVDPPRCGECPLQPGCHYASKRDV